MELRRAKQKKPSPNAASWHGLHAFDKIIHKYLFVYAAWLLVRSLVEREIRLKRVLSDGLKYFLRNLISVNANIASSCITSLLGRPPSDGAKVFQLNCARRRAGRT